jgi:hypothetical protein
MTQLGDTGFSELLITGIWRAKCQSFYTVSCPVDGFESGTILSPLCTQRNGIPQGSVLSATLCAVAINGITSKVHCPIMCSLYVEDFAVYYRSKSLPAIEWQLQLTINHLSLWSEGNSFKFLVTKTTYIHFSRLRGVFPHPILFYGQQPSPICRECQIFRVGFRQLLTWEPHIQQLRMKCQWSLNILCILTGASWGAGRMTMLRLYHCLICLWLDCGSFIYASASERILSILDHIQNCAIRLCTGAFRTNRVESVRRIRGTCTCHPLTNSNMQLCHKAVHLQEAPLLQISTPALSPMKFCAQSKGKPSGSY